MTSAVSCIDAISESNATAKLQLPPFSLVIVVTIIRWIRKILHDLRYLKPWELWYYSILRSCRILSINSSNICNHGNNRNHSNTILIIVTMVIIVLIVTWQGISAKRAPAPKYCKYCHGTWLWAYYNKVLIYSIFYLLKGDYTLNSKP